MDKLTILYGTFQPTLFEQHLLERHGYIQDVTWLYCSQDHKHTAKSSFDEMVKFHSQEHDGPDAYFDDNEWDNHSTDELEILFYLADWMKNYKKSFIWYMENGGKLPEGAYS